MAGDKIFELEQKILFMAETLKELGRCQSVTVDGFAKATDIDRERLRSAIASGNVTQELEQLLSDAVGFSPNDISWKDTRIDYRTRAGTANKRYSGFDTAENFRRTIRMKHRLPVLGNLTLRASRPVGLKKNLATLSVSAVQTGIEDTAIPIVVQLTMSPGYHPKGIAYGFKRVRLSFDFQEDSNIRLSKRLGFPDAIPLSTAHIQGTSNDFDSFWYLYTEGGFLKGDFVTGDAPLCEILEAIVGEEFSATLSVCPPDGDLVFRNSAGTSEPNPAQRAVLKSLMAEKLPGPVSSDGWISLGHQVLRVERG